MPASYHLCGGMTEVFTICDQYTIFGPNKIQYAVVLLGSFYKCYDFAYRNYVKPNYASLLLQLIVFFLCLLLDLNSSEVVVKLFAKGTLNSKHTYLLAFDFDYGDCDTLNVRALTHSAINLICCALLYSGWLRYISKCGTW